MCLNVCLIISFLFILHFVHKNVVSMSCDEDNCGSIVSKCILTQSCDCQRNDLTCYKDCLQCMGKDYFWHCCTCLGLCPKAGDLKISLSHKSHVENFEGLPELFDVFVSLPTDSLENSWKIIKLPVNYETISNNSKLKSNQIFNGNTENNTGAHTTENCTVAYFDYCVSWNKCRQSCRNIGASSYRWFHDGCCECVGPKCLNYGVNESRCKFCPEELDEEEFEEETDDPYDIEIFDVNPEYNKI